jgi:hypothetical protein
VARLLWTQKQDIGPSPRTQFGMAYDPVRKLTYLFGGTTPRQVPIAGDTWAWDGRYWTQVARFGPANRAGHSMTFDAARGHTVLFGGESAPDHGFQDTWSFDGVDWIQLEDIGPPPRSQHAAAYDLVRQRLVLFGGLLRFPNGGGPVGDTWEWNGTAWTQVEVTGPRPRLGHMMAYDTVKKRTVLFGGLAVIEGGGLEPTKDTWEWDGDSWRQVANSGPNGRFDGAMVSVGGVLIQHGGTLPEGVGETWQWETDRWSRVQVIGPRRRGHALAYDSDRNRVVLFGGNKDSDDPSEPDYFGDTWEAPGPTGGSGTQK